MTAVVDGNGGGHEVSAAVAVSQSKCEKLFLEEIFDALNLVRHAEDYRIEYNTARHQEALAWNRPHDVHTGTADPLIPNFPEPQICQLLDAGHRYPRGPVGALGP